MEELEVIGIRPYWGIDNDNQEYYKATVFALDKTEESTQKFNNLVFGTCVKMMIIEFNNRRELDTFITSINGQDLPEEITPLLCRPTLTSKFIGSRVSTKLTGLEVVQ